MLFAAFRFAIVLLSMLVGERGFPLFCFRSLAEGHVETILRRSRGRKAGKREKIVEKKTGFCVSDSDALRRRYRGGKSESSFFLLNLNPFSNKKRHSFLPLSFSFSCTCKKKKKARQVIRARNGRAW